MPRDKDRKRVIRRRMAKTGESYTAARAHVISKRHPKPSTVRVDYATRAGMSDEKVVAKTGRTWHEWTRLLDAEKASARPHGEIARLVQGKYGVGSWWTQMVTVGYERIKGLREIGQRRSGSYEASKSRTFDVTVETLFDAWADARTRRRWLDGAAPVVRTAARPKSMRLQWPDGTIVAVWFMPKSDAKSTVVVQHMKLADKAAAEKAKTYWSGRFDALKLLFATRTS